jgi:hypothetical protein
MFEAGGEANTRDFEWLGGIGYIQYTIQYRHPPHPPPPPHYDFRQQQGITIALRSVVDPDWILLQLCHWIRIQESKMASIREKHSCFEERNVSVRH